VDFSDFAPADATTTDGARKDGGRKRRNLSAALGQLDTPMLRRPVGFDQADIEIESALRDRRAEVDGKGQRIAGPLRMVDQRPQDGGGGRATERADKSPVIVAGPPLPAAVTGGNPRRVVEQVLAFVSISALPSLRANGRANARR